MNFSLFTTEHLQAGYDREMAAFQRYCLRASKRASAEQAAGSLDSACDAMSAAADSLQEAIDNITQAVEG